MSTLTQILLGGGIVLGALLLFVLYSYLVERSRGRLERRLNHIDPDQSGVLARRSREQETTGLSASVDRGFVRMIERTGMDVTPDQALGITALCGVMTAAALYLWRESFWVTLFGFVVGMSVPLLIFFIYQGRYRRQLQDQLPDAFYLLARSLRVGLSLEQALKAVSDQGSKPLADEFRRCCNSIELGLPIGTALQIMAERIDLLDFNAFVSTVSFYQSTGGNLALLLDRLAAGTRDRNQFRGQFMAATAQGRVTAIAMGAAVPIMLLAYLLFEPDHVQAFFRDPRGWTLLGVMFLLQIIGVVWLWNILKVDY